MLPVLNWTNMGEKDLFLHLEKLAKEEMAGRDDDEILVFEIELQWKRYRFLPRRKWVCKSVITDKSENQFIRNRFILEQFSESQARTIKKFIQSRNSFYDINGYRPFFCMDPIEDSKIRFRYERSIVQRMYSLVEDATLRSRKRIRKEIERILRDKFISTNPAKKIILEIQPRTRGNSRTPRTVLDTSMTDALRLRVTIDDTTVVVGHADADFSFFVPKDFLDTECIYAKGDVLCGNYIVTEWRWNDGDLFLELTRKKEPRKGPTIQQRWNAALRRMS